MFFCRFSSEKKKTKSERYKQLALTQYKQFGMDDAAAYESYGIFTLDDGFALEALAALESAIRINPHIQRFYDKQGEILFRLGRSDEALKSYRQALEADTGWNHSYLMIGKVFEQRGNAKDAWNSYKKFLTKDSTSPEAAELRKRLHAAQH
jgi:tetratricopeptide (TPR) repeat protein